MEKKKIKLLETKRIVTFDDGLGHTKFSNGDTVRGTSAGQILGVIVEQKEYYDVLANIGFTIKINEIGVEQDETKET